MYEYTTLQIHTPLRTLATLLSNESLTAVQ